ncbi:hypothetical protein V8B97DRAFT_1918390 [Scleroderma yunnanense]
MVNCLSSDVADKALQYKITHVFFPLQLPSEDDHSLSNDRALSEAAYASALTYAEHLSGPEKLLWQHIVRMLHGFNDTIALDALDERLVISQLQSMSIGGKKLADETLAESFEVSPCAKAVMNTRGKLMCSYPGPAIAVPNEVFGDSLFASELAHFLVRMSSDNLDVAPMTRKAGSMVVEERMHPRYITELLTGILRGVGRPVDIQRISKRIGDDAVYNGSWDTVDRRYRTKLLTGIVRRAGKLVGIQRISKHISDDPWRRSPLWLIIRVAVQTTLERNALGRNVYKIFMLFFMNQLARKAFQYDISSDVLQWIVAKISRRLKKLGESAPEWLSVAVLGTCKNIRTLLDRRWKQIQAIDAVSPFWAPSTLDFSTDARLSMLHSSHYIRRALSSVHSTAPSSAFRHECRVRGTLVDFLSNDGKFFQTAYAREHHLTLYHVEREVCRGIDQWVMGISMSGIDSASESLQLLAAEYSRAALQTYKGNPEAISRMFLTVIDIWIGLDKLVMRQIPMLANYSPEVPISLLERLILRHPEDLRQLRAAFRYIRNRHSVARNGWSVFSNRADPDSFPVRYYNESSRLQTLMSQIVKDANSARTRTLKELNASNALHAQLQSQAAHAKHNHKPTSGNLAKTFCRKCRVEKKMNRMRINVHEWPLPEDLCHAASVVFELGCPVAFNMWRSTILTLLVDRDRRDFRNKPSILQNSHLYPYYTKKELHRVTLASDAEPFTTSHYHVITIPSEQSKVCVNIGLDYHYFDRDTHSRISDAIRSLDISSLCSYHLGPGPYQNLQQYLRDTTHTSNDVICNQADCHRDLSVHEFLAFGHLRSGPFLQWMNILREVRANTLNFRREEVHMLFAQAAGQVGPCSNTEELVWHHELKQSSFRRSLLKELEYLVAAASDNWLECMTMNTVIFLVSRLLAEAPTVEDGIDTTDQACQLLHAISEKTFCWVLELLEILKNTTDKAKKTELQSQLCDIAAICRSTFDFGELNNKMHLLDSSRAIEILLTCAIIIHDNTPVNLDSLSKISQLLLERDRHLSWKLQDVISGIITGGNEGIDFAVKHLWPAYGQCIRERPWLRYCSDIRKHPGSTYCRCIRWSRSCPAGCTWFTTRTLGSEGQQSRQVYLNILNGSLLVDGKAVRTLPRVIRAHPLFMSIFSDRVLDVVRSDINGMEYTTLGLISGHQVYFRMAGNKLIIRAKEKHCDDILELIPPKKLEFDLPAVLIEDHAHWLNLTTGSIEVRPLAQVWQSSPDNWHLQFSPGHHCIKKGHKILLDIRSPSWKMISSRLEPLEVPQNLIITLTSGCDKPEVSIELPRYGLTFFINNHGELESCNLRDMVYDDAQSMGTLFGLVNRLVLRPKLNTSHKQRCVLIPEGEISFTRRSHHVRVVVNVRGPPCEQVTYQTFRIDTELGCLTGNVSLANQLYRAYLHALTSNPCSVDPLTKKTGTEEALSILRSAACRSFMKIDSRAARLLRNIASLTTQRRWDSLDLKSRQRVYWAPLPVASQHHGLYLSCLSIVEIHKSLQQLFHHDNHTLFVDFPMREEYLLHRASLRAASLYPPEFRDPLQGDSYDAAYTARDLLQPATGEVRAYGAALAIYSWSPRKPSSIDIYSLLEQATKPLTGPKGQTISLRYSKYWLSPNLPDDWLPVYDMCRQSHMQQHRFRLLFSLPALAYSSVDFDDVAHALVAIAVLPQFKNENPPAHRSYVLSDKDMPTAWRLHMFLSSCAVSVENSSEDVQGYWVRLQRDSITTATKLTVQWPSRTPPPCDFLDSSLYNLEELSSKVRKLFSSCYQNWELKMHLDRVQDILGKISVSPGNLSDYIFTPGARIFLTGYETTMANLFSRPTPTLPLSGQIISAPIRLPTTSGSVEELRQLIDTIRRKSTNPLHVKYADELDQSEILYRNESPSVPQAPEDLDIFKAHCDESRERYMQCVGILADSLGPRTKSECAVNESGQWPRITPKALLSCIASTSRISVPRLWRDCLILFAKFGLEYQRARRMLLLATQSQFEDLCKEMENTGCDGWEAELYPDWLLIQLEGDFLIRGIQADIASEMIAPRSGQNTSLQLHMGEGKSSVIIPMAASVLASGDQLLRVVVPKALTNQMFQLLVDRLGGLTNRRIYHLPFSRSIQLDQSHVEALLAILEECEREGGILIAQSDHILSFKLMTVEKQVDQDENVAAELLRTQQWLHSHVRDILDECDEILHVRNQLVYTVGSKQPLHGFPERWTSAQQILSLVKSHAASLQACFPRGVEIEPRPRGAFPHFRILHHEAGNGLILRIAQDIMDGLLPNFGFSQAPQNVQGAIFNFLTFVDIPPSEVQIAHDYTTDTHTWNGLLHLRGLLAFGILLFALKERRWRVDFGLAPRRTMLAVPYRAKDVPAPRAEFGQPDVAVVLTCLSYYYEGLTEDQLAVCFKLLLQQDDSTQEYEAWVRDLSLVPDTFRHVSGINIKSSEQWREHLVPMFSHNKATIDYYLSQVVFPRAAKEFSFKLSCSSWDLTEERPHVVTGFSGTNDGRYLLPTSITQRDPDHQRGSNARVLAYLLQPENDGYMMMSLLNGERRTAREFLELVVDQKPEIRAILDVGAQVLELQNSEFAAAWLELKLDAVAAIYFNEDDELMVLTRRGTTQPLLESSFAHRLDECVVYLDDAHTRGTDIRFPNSFRAAVTLGSKVTKDRLTQGCMRMRRLGNGHSVMFFAPLDVDMNIRTISSKSESDTIHTRDILQWAMITTCAEIENHAIFWAQQGVDYASRSDSWSKFSNHEISLDEVRRAWCQPDAKTLEELYAATSPCDLRTISIPSILQRCLDLNVSSLDPNLDEEQEREIVHEVERELEVKTPKVLPAVHQVSQDVREFVQGKFITPLSPAFHRAFSLAVIGSIHPEDTLAWGQSLFVTADFRTVVPDGHPSEYLRPVNWVLSRIFPSGPILIILSSFEVNELLPDITTSTSVHLHIYTPRTREAVRPCDDLLLYSIPTVPRSWTAPIPLVDQLNLFAGQLYLCDYMTYIRVCRYLCVYAKDLDHEGYFEVQSDGFIEPAHRPLRAQTTGAFQRSPLPLLRHLIILRRMGMRFAHTHMGKILDGRLLREEDFLN